QRLSNPRATRETASEMKSRTRAAAPASSQSQTGQSARRPERASAVSACQRCGVRSRRSIGQACGIEDVLGKSFVDSHIFEAGGRTSTRLQVTDSALTRKRLARSGLDEEVFELHHFE